MNLLILTQYFPPETGAPQNRLYELAVRLKKLGVNITVLTAMPNYPQMKIHETYEGKKYHYEEMDGIPVHRCSIYMPSNMGVLERLKNYFSFVWSSIRTGPRVIKDIDYVFCESPPLFLGISALYLCRRFNAKLIFNVADLWPESAEKLGVVRNRFFLWIAYRLEAFLYRRSIMITGQAMGICDDIRKRFPSKDVYWLPNGADTHLYNPERIRNSGWREEHGFGNEDFVVLYAGILGVAQGLEIIIEAAEKLKGERKIQFVLQGNGPEENKLKELIKKYELKNIRITSSVPKSRMPEILASVDASVVPLKKLDIFIGIIPSKIFEALSMEVPILLGVDGESRSLFIDEANAGLFFEPEDHLQLAAAVETLFKNAEIRKNLGANGREYVLKCFDRDLIAKNFYEKLMLLG